MVEEANLEELRKDIARVTLDIIRLAGERVFLAKKIAKIKARENVPIEDPKVEEELKDKVLNICQKYDVDQRFCLELLNLLISESKRVQREVIGSKT